MDTDSKIGYFSNTRMPEEKNEGDGIYQVNGTDTTATVNPVKEPLVENHTEGSKPKEYGITVTNFCFKRYFLKYNYLVTSGIKEFLFLKSP